MKIHIIGGPGSGKTTLARRIASYLKCDILHLDEVAYSNGDFDIPTIREYRLSETSRFTKNEAWVVEGVYFSWVGSSFKHCDKILFLSVDKDSRRINILNKLSKRVDLSCEQLEEQRARLLKSNDEYDALYEKRISGFLRKFEGKIVTLSGCEFDPQELLVGTDFGTN